MKGHFVLMLPGVAALTPVVKADLVFSQSPSSSGKSFDIGDLRQANDFTLAADTTIQNLGFWYQVQFETDLSQLKCAIHAHGSGAPESLIRSEGLVSVLSADADSGDYFATADVAPLTLDYTGMRS